MYPKLAVGNQKLRLKLLDQGWEGKEIEVENILINTSSILAKEGSRLIVLIGVPEGTEPTTPSTTMIGPFPLSSSMVTP